MTRLPPFEALQIARREGVIAAKAGKDITDNPYPKPTPAYKENHSRDTHGSWTLGFISVVIQKAMAKRTEQFENAFGSRDNKRRPY